ncbi:acid phosphatase-like protein [Citrus sinensis]|nr:acid phosphatase-like protein [Citrus sinensis]
MDCCKFLLVISLHSFLISHAFSQSVIQIFPGRIEFAGDRKIRAGDELYCDSWRFSVETNDAGEWDSVPSRCVEFVQKYMTGEHYLSDSEIVSGYSLKHAKSANVSAGDGKDAWVFDIDETLLSNLPYYAAHGFGYFVFFSEPLDWISLFVGSYGVVILPQALGSGPGFGAQQTLCGAPNQQSGAVRHRSEIFNEDAFDEWVDLAKAPALPASLNFYKELKQLGFKIFLLTGRNEFQRNTTEKNLLFAGYSDWKKLFLRGPSDQGKPATVYKSEKRLELVNEGYRIHGSSGDQWSDLLGFAKAERSFKLPNPMYYIA